MIHARPDYNRIQDPAGKIGDDEPVFLIRGQDKSGPSTLRFWADNNLALGGDPELSRLAREHAIAMESWQQHHKAKAADLPKLTHVCGSQGFGAPEDTCPACQPSTVGRHASHVVRSSDSSSYDYKCVNCGATDVAGGGWGELEKPCRAISNSDLAGAQPKDQRETCQVKKRTVWVAYTNTDCTEGRGAEVPFAICTFKTTALRLARKCYVQGTDGPVRPMELVNVAGKWCMLGKPVTVVEPSAEDLDVEMQAFARQIAPPPEKVQKTPDNDLTQHFKKCQQQVEYWARKVEKRAAGVEAGPSLPPQAAQEHATSSPPVTPPAEPEEWPAMLRTRRFIRREAWNPEAFIWFQPGDERNHSTVMLYTRGKVHAGWVGLHCDHHARDWVYCDDLAHATLQMALPLGVSFATPEAIARITAPVECRAHETVCSTCGNDIRKCTKLFRGNRS